MKVWQQVVTSGVVLGATVTVLTFAGRYVVGQEVQRELEPVKMEMRATSKVIADMQFEERYNESQALLLECLSAEDAAEDYCYGEDEWRWEVHYPYLDCISGLEYAARGDTCGPPPEFEAPE